LSASLEDRPFVPHSSVLFPSEEGVELPRDLKVAFRKWDDRIEVVGKKCKVLPLSAALEAMRG